MAVAALSHYDDAATETADASRAFAQFTPLDMTAGNVRFVGARYG